MALSPPPTTKQQNRPGAGLGQDSSGNIIVNPFTNQTIPGAQIPGQTSQTNPKGASPVTGTPLPQPDGGIAKGSAPRVAPETAPSGGTVNTAAQAADAFQKNMPGYIYNQTQGAQDTARTNLASDIQKAKSDANARGLLYSGQEAGGELAARANEGSQLASNIQGINSNALGTLATLQGNAVTEASQEGANATQMAALQAQASQTAYEQALQEQGAQDQYYEGLMGGVGKFIGGAAAVAGD